MYRQMYSQQVTIQYMQTHFLTVLFKVLEVFLSIHVCQMYSVFKASPKSDTPVCCAVQVHIMDCGTCGGVVWNEW